jgi:hypothetical protein
MGLITRLSNPNKTAGVEPVQEQPFSKRVNWTNQQGIENTRRIQQKAKQKKKKKEKEKVWTRISLVPVACRWVHSTNSGGKGVEMQKIVRLRLGRWRNCFPGTLRCI